MSVPSPPDPNIERRPSVPRWFIFVISFTFAWVFIGISVIIGIRMFLNSPIHPSFALFGAVAFSSITAFAIVLALEIVTGNNLTFKFANLEFTGTSGPVTLWILAFLAIMLTFISGGVQDLAKSNISPYPPLHQVLSPSPSQK
jgi:hypothetical protein